MASVGNIIRAIICTGTLVAAAAVMGASEMDLLASTVPGGVSTRNVQIAGVRVCSDPSGGQLQVVGVRRAGQHPGTEAIRVRTEPFNSTVRVSRRGGGSCEALRAGAELARGRVQLPASGGIVWIAIDADARVDLSRVRSSARS